MKDVTSLLKISKTTAVAYPWVLVCLTGGPGGAGSNDLDNNEYGKIFSPPPHTIDTNYIKFECIVYMCGNILGMLYSLYHRQYNKYLKYQFWSNVILCLPSPKPLRPQMALWQRQARLRASSALWPWHCLAQSPATYPTRRRSYAFPYSVSPVYLSSWCFPPVKCKM